MTHGLTLRVQQEFEECLSLEWRFDGYSTTAALNGPRFVVEMVLDLSGTSVDEKGPLVPARSSTVKRVEMGTDRSAFVQNMPEARKFLVCVVAKRDGEEVARSSWVRASTLDPKARELDLGNRDPNGIHRVSCSKCTCAGYIPFRFSLNSADLTRCRRCGCDYVVHESVQVGAILEDREEKACKALRRAKVKPLPPEALEWDTRECNLWFCTNGVVHPRRTCAENREPQASKGGGMEGVNGRKGRVSVVSPTMQTRQHFHAVLWTVFEAQTWPDKELVIVETYQNSHSKFFADLAATDHRVVYVKFQLPLAQDWSIGLKRNIGAHFATGEFIANFDDDDLYAPCYLTNMLTFLEDKCAEAIKLSSWFIFQHATASWAFCDPVAWGLARGLDETSQDVRNWKYGYGFSYVFRRRIGLEICYDDINLGEDFNFITSVLNRKGENSVALFHDDFGICCHVQHGSNTSNSIPLRDVGRREAGLLDVMELKTVFKQTAFQHHLRTTIAAKLFNHITETPSEKNRQVIVHTLQITYKLQCAVCASAADVLAALQQRLDEYQKDRQPSEGEKETSCSVMRVYRVDPEAKESERHKAAVNVLGLSFLAHMDGAEYTLSPETVCGKQWRDLLEKACRPIHNQDRIGLRTSELWVRPPAVKQQAQDSSWFGEEEEFMIVSVTCQKSSVRNFHSDSVRVQIPAGSTVADLRSMLDADLPPNAKIMVEKDEVGLVTLRDNDPLPSSVFLSDFRGRRKFYTLFTARQTAIACRVLKEFFGTPETQRRLDQMSVESGGDKARYNMVLCNLLAYEAYPLVLKGLNIYSEDAFVTVYRGMRMLGHSQNIDLMILWLETELLMRNETNARMALDALGKAVQGETLATQRQPNGSVVAAMFFGENSLSALSNERVAEAMAHLTRIDPASSYKEAAEAIESLKRIISVHLLEASHVE